MIKIRLYIILILVTCLTISKSQTIVSNDLLRNLYIGVDNPISLTNLNTQNSLLNIAVDFGEIKKINNTSYIWKICYSNKAFVYLKVFNGQNLVDSIRFKLIQIPNPVLRTCIQDDEIMFKACVGVRADIENFVLENIKCKVERFSISIIKKTGDTLKFYNVGPYYQSKFFNELVIGDKVILYDFEVMVGCETTPRKLTQTFSSVYSGKKYEVRF